MIAVIVPFSRPQMAANVRANFGRQREPAPSKLIVVENGPALGAWRTGHWLDEHVTQSAHGRSHARTAGLRKAREIGCEWFAYWDDDDWYAPGFLEFMWQRRDLADVVALARYVGQDPDGKRWLIPGTPGLLRPEPPLTFVGGIACPTLFGRVDRALDWDAHVPFAEELFWYRAMIEQGRTIRGLAEPNPSDPIFVRRWYADPNHGHAFPDWRRDLESCNAVPLAA